MSVHVEFEWTIHHLSVQQFYFQVYFAWTQRVPRISSGYSAWMSDCAVERSERAFRAELETGESSYEKLAAVYVRARTRSNVGVAVQRTRRTRQSGSDTVEL